MRQEQRNQWIDLSDNETRRTYFFSNGNTISFDLPQALCVNSNGSHIIRKFDGVEAQVGKDWDGFTAKGEWAFEVEGDPNNSDWNDVDPGVVLEFHYDEEDEAEFVFRIEDPEQIRIKPSGSIKIAAKNGLIHYIRPGYAEMRHVYPDASDPQSELGFERSTLAAFFIGLLFIPFMIIVIELCSSFISGSIEERHLESSVISERESHMRSAGIVEIKHETFDYQGGCYYDVIFELNGTYFSEEFYSPCPSTRLGIRSHWSNRFGFESPYEVTVEPSDSESNNYSAMNVSSVLSMSSDLNGTITKAIETVEAQKKIIDDNNI